MGGVRALACVEEGAVPVLKRIEAIVHAVALLAAPPRGIHSRPARESGRREVYSWLAESDATPSVMGPPLCPDSSPPTWDEFCADYGPHFFDASALEWEASYIIEAAGLTVGPYCVRKISERQGPGVTGDDARPVRRRAPTSACPRPSLRPPPVVEWTEDRAVDPKESGMSRRVRRTLLLMTGLAALVFLALVPVTTAQATVLWEQGDYLGRNYNTASAPRMEIVMGDDFSNAVPWVIDTISISIEPGGREGDIPAYTWDIYADDGIDRPVGSPFLSDGDSPFWSLYLELPDPQVGFTSLGIREAVELVLTLETPIVLPPGHWWLVPYPTYSDPEASAGVWWLGSRDRWGRPMLKSLGAEGGDWLIMPNGDYNSAMFRLEGRVAMTGAPTPTPTPTPTFTDVPESHPNYEAIADLFTRKIVEGFDQESFGPDRPVIRQQFAKMLLLTLAEYDPERFTATTADDCTFTDAAAMLAATKAGSLYPYHYVAKAASTGLTLGLLDGSFAPYAEITRAQAVTMVVRAAEVALPGILPEPPLGFSLSWTGLDTEHRQNAAIAEAAGLLEGLAPSGTLLSELDPYAPMPRGEVAQVLYNLLENIGGVTPPGAE